MEDQLVENLQKSGEAAVRHEPNAPRKELISREIIAALISFDLILGMAVLLKTGLGPAAGLGAQGQIIHAPWIFSGIQLLLFYLPVPVAGIFLPALFVAFLFWVPYLERRFKPVTVKLFFYMLMLGAVLFTLVGNYL